MQPSGCLLTLPGPEQTPVSPLPLGALAVPPVPATHRSGGWRWAWPGQRWHRAAALPPGQAAGQGPAGARLSQPAVLGRKEPITMAPAALLPSRQEDISWPTQGYEPNPCVLASSSTLHPHSLSSWGRCHRAWGRMLSSQHASSRERTKVKLRCPQYLPWQDVERMAQVAWGRHRLAPSLCVVWCFALAPLLLTGKLTAAVLLIILCALAYSPCEVSFEPSTTQSEVYLSRKLTHHDSTAAQGRNPGTQQEPPCHAQLSMLPL